MRSRQGAAAGDAAGKELAMGVRAIWLAGVLLGVLAGVLALVGGVLGVVFAAALLGWALLARPRAAAFSGLLIGAGSAWLLFLARAELACRGFTGPGRGCVSPDLTPWVAVALVLLAAGLAMATAELARRRPS